MEKIVIIPARGNSKGIPRKNLYPVAGNPLLYYTIKASKDSGQFDKIIISSEDEEILAYAKEMGVIPDRRNDELSTDNIHAVHVILDYVKVNNISPDTCVAMLLPTSPLRTSQDIIRAFEIFEKGNADSVLSVYESSKHIMNFRYIDEKGYLESIMEGDRNVQRQDMKKLYTVNGSIYISSAGNLLDSGSYHLGKVQPYIMPKSRSVDINSIEEIQEVERIIKS
ncbi:cytidylyltransferase domain-containing protein [Bacteroidota bacterium]